MAFEQSGIGAATSGAGAVLGLQQKMQEAAVRPRELEAATSLAESRATVAKSQVASMQEMAGLQKAAADKFKASGEAQTLANANKYQIQEFTNAGKAEEANKLQKQQSGLEHDALKNQSAAIGLEADKNDMISNQLDSMSSIGEYNAFAKAQLVEAETAIRSGKGTQQDALRLVRAREAVANADGWKEFDPDGSRFSEFKQAEIDPLMQSLKSAKQKAIDQKNTVDDANRKVQLAEAERHNKEMEHWKLQEAAAKKDGQGISKQLKFSIDAAKLDKSYDTEAHKLQLEIEKLETEAPTTKLKGSGIIWDDDQVNPLITSKRAELQELKERHDENLAGLQKATDEGRLFVPSPKSKSPKPVEVKDKLVAPQRPTSVPEGSQYSPSTKTWWKDGKKVG